MGCEFFTEYIIYIIKSEYIRTCANEGTENRSHDSNAGEIGIYRTVTQPTGSMKFA